ncbi:MAG: ferredoxin [Clostridia bacterium]|nr:ferredoxin [Clostridia bacterium]
MKVTIIEGCIGCGLCVGACPDVFCMQDDGTARVCNAPTKEQESVVKEAAEGCPVSVILTE